MCEFIVYGLSESPFHVTGSYKATFSYLEDDECVHSNGVIDLGYSPPCTRSFTALTLCVII